MYKRQEEGVATSVKHFPGDGVDERDQHLVTSVNALSCKEWNESYGKIYKEMIEAGTLTVMADVYKRQAADGNPSGSSKRQ